VDADWLVSLLEAAVTSVRNALRDDLDKWQSQKSANNMPAE